MISQLQPKLDFVPADKFIVDDLETLKVIADPLRLRIRELMEHPTTVKAVATKLDLPPTKLYYHINLLEKHGLIVLVNTQLVSGIVEKHYQLSAQAVQVAKHLLSPNDDPEGTGINLTIGAMLDSARKDLIQSARDGVVEWDDEGERHKGVAIQTATMNLTEDQAAQFYQELEQLVSNYVALSNKQQSEAYNVYRALYLLFPSEYAEQVISEEGA